MKRQTSFSVAILGILMLILSSCGGGGAGAPGSDTADTGVIIDSYVVPYYLSVAWEIENEELKETIDGKDVTVGNLSKIEEFKGNFTNLVDVVQIADCDPSNVKPDPEPFTDHTAVLVINARLLNPNSPFKPGNLFITEYKIDYFRSTDSLGAPPIQSDRRFTTIMINTTSPFIGKGNIYTLSSIVFVDLIRKNKYLQDLNSGLYTSRPGLLNNYTAEYTFYGMDSNGKSFSFKVRHDFTIGSFDYCGLL